MTIDAGETNAGGLELEGEDSGIADAGVLGAGAEGVAEAGVDAGCEARFTLPT